MAHEEDKLTKTTRSDAQQISPTSTKSDFKKRDLLNKLGGPGTDLVDGYLSEEYNAALQGTEKYDVFNRMRRSDAQVFASLLVCELPIRSTRWYIDPARNEKDEVDPEDQEVADFVEKALFEVMEQPWDSWLLECLTMLPMGFSCFEKIYMPDKESDKIWLRKMAFRRQETIDRWETDGGAAGVRQILPTALETGENAGDTMVSIPAEKLIIFSFRREGDNYEGVSVLRSAYKHWFIKDQLYKFDSVRHERASIGIPVIYLPDNATDEDKEEALNIVKNIRGTEQTGVVMPGSKDSGWLFEFADLRAEKGTDLFESIKHHNREISKNVLAQFLELGATESGSRALDESQQSLFIIGLESVAKQIDEVISRFLIPELVDMNFDVERYPRLKHDKLGNVDYSQLSTSLKNLADSNILTPDLELEQHVRAIMDMPVRKDIGKPSEDTRDAVMQKKISERDPNFKKAIDKKAEEQEPSADEVQAHEHEHVDDDETKEFKEICRRIDNDFIIRLQNECRTPEDYAVLKKKGFKFNEFEKDSPRPLTFAEKKVNFKSIKRAMDTFGEKLENDVTDITEKQKQDLLRQVKKAVDNNDIKALGELKVKNKGELSQALTDVQKEMFEIGKKTASTEMNVKVPPTKSEVRGAMRVQNDALVDDLGNRMQDTAKLTSAEFIQKNGGSISQVGSAAVVAAVAESLDKTVSKARSTLNTVGVTGAVNLGRSTIFERFPERVFAFQYSAIIDDRTTNFCLSMDGRVVKPGSTEFVDLSPPNHFNCRSIWVEILVDETFKPKVTPIPSSIPRNKSITTQADMKKPIVLKGSPAVKQIQDEIKERKEKLAKLESSGTFPNRQRDHKKRIKQLESAIKKKFFENVKDVLKKEGIKFKF